MFFWGVGAGAEALGGGESSHHCATGCGEHFVAHRIEGWLVGVRVIGDLPSGFGMW